MVDIKESGAAGALGVIGQVNGRATAVLSSFAAALGLDAPVEVRSCIHPRNVIWVLGMAAVLTRVHFYNFVL